MHRVIGLSALLVVAMPLAANAQFIPNIDPGRIQERFDDRERPAVRDDSIVDGIELPTTGPELSDTIRFTLNQVNIAGNTAIPTADLAPLYQDKIGTEVSLQDVQAIVNAITSYMRNEGYILSRAILPPQRIGEGEVTIQIVEGYINNIEFQGEPVSGSVAERYAKKIRNSKPLNAADLERYLLLIDDLAGMTARGSLRASSEPNASDLIITLERKKIDGRVTVDNRGSRFLGPLQGDVALSANDLFDLNERISLRTVQTLNLEELSYIEGSWQQPIGNEGTSLRILASTTDTEPGNSLEPLNIEGDSVTVLVEATHPYIRSRRENLYLTGGFTWRDSESDTLGIQTFEDNIRSINLGIAYDFIDGWQGITQLSSSIVQGLDMLGANSNTDPVSRANAQSDFTKFTASASRLQSLNNQFALQLTARGQYADDELYASEEFGAGGAAFGSAYDSSEISGDRGIAGRAELQYNGTYTTEWLDRYQVYGFYDAARIWNINALAGESKRASLTSTGLGLRFNMLDQWQGSLEYAAPITRNVAAEGSDGPDNRVFFSLSYFLP